MLQSRLWLGLLHDLTAYNAMYSCTLPATPAGQAIASAVIEMTIVNTIGGNPLTLATWSKNGASKAFIDLVRCIAGIVR